MEEVELNITDLIEEGKMVLDLVQDSFESQRKVLLDRLLSIENPELNHEMLEFLLYPQNCQDLLNIMCASNRGNRFTREDAGRNHINIKITDEENNKKDADPDLVKAYRALYLLTRNESSPPLAIFIEKKGFELGACIFKMFEENSGASFWHVFEILTFLLRNRCKCVHEAMLAGGYSSFASRFDTILKYVGHEPVEQIILILLTEPPVSEHTSLPDHFAQFFAALKTYPLVDKIYQILTFTSEMCVINEEEGYTEDTCISNCLSFLYDMINRNIFSDNYNFLSQLMTHSKILEHIYESACTQSKFTKIQKLYLQIATLLIKQSQQPYFNFWMNGNLDNGQSSQHTSIPNLLHEHQKTLLNCAKLSMKNLITCLISSSSNSIGSNNGISSSQVDVDEIIEGKDYSLIKSKIVNGHTSTHGYNEEKRKKPFGSMRLEMIEYLVGVIQTDMSMTSQIKSDTWSLFISWLTEYPENNMFHINFYRLFFCVLRCNDNDAQKALFGAPNNFLDYLLDQITINDDKMGHRTCIKCTKTGVSGLLMNCMNATRLHLGDTLSLTTDDYVKFTADASDRWTEMMPHLVLVTHHMYESDLAGSTNGGHDESAISALLENGDADNAYNKCPRLARCLGFSNLQ